MYEKFFSGRYDELFTIQKFKSKMVICRARFLRLGECRADGGLFPKHWGPNWPTNSCVVAKSSPLRGFWGVPFCLFWQLISARMPGLCARAQNFWAQGGLTIHPKHPWENSPNLWRWCFKLVPLFWQAVLSTKIDAKLNYRLTVFISLCCGIFIWISYQARLTSELSIIDRNYPFTDWESFSRTNWK